MAKNNFKNNYKPHGHLAIDEAMIKWTGTLSFKQYLPAKPIKRRIKVWMRCDSVNAYLTDFEIYLGKGTQVSEHGCHTVDNGHHMKLFPCLLWQLFHKCPTDGGFVSRQNLCLWNCKNESKRVPGWPEGSPSTSKRPVTYTTKRKSHCICVAGQKTCGLPKYIKWPSSSSSSDKATWTPGAKNDTTPCG